MAALGSLFDRYYQLVVLDTETTGLRPESDDIIQLCALVVRPMSGVPTVERVYHEYVSLPGGRTIPPEIRTLTGITDHDLHTRGISPRQLCRDLKQLLDGTTLLVAYNAHFDLSFLFHTLCNYGDPAILQGKDKLDLLTVYRDRRAGSHRLAAALEAYGVAERNSHSAAEDALAAYHLMLAMAQERDDLERYLNLFGYSPKYGCPPRRIRSAVYCRQEGFPEKPVYQSVEKLPEIAPLREPFTLGEFYKMFAEDAENARRPLEIIPGKWI